MTQSPAVPGDKTPGHGASVISSALSRRALLATALLAACSPTPRQTAASPRPSASEPPGHSTGPTPAGPAVEITHGPRGTDAVALTFHGAGDPRLAAALLDEAQRAGARVTVLAVGSWLQAYPAMAGRILDSGHELGNHTLTHPSLRRLGAAACYGEIAGCARVLQQLTGTPGRWFRPSGTPNATPLIAAQAGRAGYRTTLSYDVDPRDYTDPGAAAVRGRTLAAIQPGSIVSLHLGHAGTVAALPAILEGLRARGQRAVTASGLLGDGHP